MPLGASTTYLLTALCLKPYQPYPHLAPPSSPPHTHTCRRLLTSMYQGVLLLKLSIVDNVVHEAAFDLHNLYVEASVADCSFTTLLSLKVGEHNPAWNETHLMYIKWVERVGG